MLKVMHLHLCIYASCMHRPTQRSFTTAQQMALEHASWNANKQDLLWLACEVLRKPQLLAREVLRKQQLLAREVLRKQREVAEFPPYLLDCRLVSVPSVKIDQASGGAELLYAMCSYAFTHVYTIRL